MVRANPNLVDTGCFTVKLWLDIVVDIVFGACTKQHFDLLAETVRALWLLKRVLDSMNYFLIWI